MTLTAGSRWRSTVCETEVVVVRAPTGPGVLECGGAPVAELGATVTPSDGPLAGLDTGTRIGKRYTGPDGIEVLCTKGGAGSLALSGSPLELRSAKPLPSSD